MEQNKNFNIGILTYHRSHNYGAVLQAYALKAYTQSLGHNVEFVDYWPDYHKGMYAILDWKLIKRFNRGAISNLLLWFPFVYKRKKKKQDLFNNFIDQHLMSSKKGELGKEYDIVIYGSDQIWRYQDSPTYKGYNEVYFGDSTIKAKRKITYSASMGVVNIKKNENEYFTKLLKNFDAISIREKDLIQVLQPLTTLDIVHTLDPVFLLSKEQWKALCVPSLSSAKYILLYNLQGDANAIKIAQLLSEKYKLPIIEILGSVNCRFEQENKISVSGPIEFITYIMNAEFVVTSSFHGVAFSILMGKQFFASQMTNTHRVKSLLSLLGLNERFIDEKLKIDVSDIDYTFVDDKMNLMKTSSMQYLKNELHVDL